MARSCVVRASCANASARSANRLRVYLQPNIIGVEGLVFKVYFVEPPKRIVVDSRSCGSKGGGCNTQKSLCSTLFPCQERQALAIGPGKCQQCQPVASAQGQAKGCHRRSRTRAIVPASSSFRRWTGGPA
eukprot:scaffold9772_cov128-Isochrysis_galbana.AAC.10